MDTKRESNGNGWRRKSDTDILHAAKGLIQCEMAMNHQVDKLLGLIGLSRAEVCKGVEDEK